MKKVLLLLLVLFVALPLVRTEDDDEENIRVNPLLILKGLTIDKWIIDALSIIILGPTGVGKSTLVNLLAGFSLKAK